MLDKTKDFMNWSDQICRRRMAGRPDLKHRYVIRNINNHHLLQKGFFREELLPDMMPENMPRMEDEGDNYNTKPDKKSDNDKDKERLRRERISRAIDSETEILPERKRILPKRFRD